MKYIYTLSNCPKCEAKKSFYKNLRIPFEERSADKIKNPQDDIDQEALIQASMQNMEMPVEIEK